MAVQGAEGAGMKSWFAVDTCCRSLQYIIVQRFGDTQVPIEAVDLVNSVFAVDWTRSIWNILPSCPVNTREHTVHCILPMIENQSVDCAC
jgi:hypothetical protein